MMDHSTESIDDDVGSDYSPPEGENSEDHTQSSTFPVFPVSQSARDRQIHRAATIRGRDETSELWKHMKQSKDNETGKNRTHCNYCDKTWLLGGSTSTGWSHLKSDHLNKLSPEDLGKLRGHAKETTPSSRLPSRASSRGTLFYNEIRRHSYVGRDLDTKLGKAIISASMSLNVLDNIDFAIFCEAASHNTYKLPSRGYMNSTIIPIVYKAGVVAVKKCIDKVQHLSLTTDV